MLAPGEPGSWAPGEPGSWHQLSEAELKSAVLSGIVTQQVCPHIAMHWSLGGAPPTLPGCRYPVTVNNVTQQGAMNMTADTVHIALVTDLDGYVIYEESVVVDGTGLT